MLNPCTLLNNDLMLSFSTVSVFVLFVLLRILHTFGIVGNSTHSVEIHWDTLFTYGIYLLTFYLPHIFTAFWDATIQSDALCSDAGGWTIKDHISLVRKSSQSSKLQCSPITGRVTEMENLTLSCDCFNIAAGKTSKGSLVKHYTGQVMAVFEIPV